MKKIFFTETTRPRALIFGMRQNLVDLYHVCSNDAPGAQNEPAREVTCLHRLIYGIYEKNLLV